MARGPTLLKFPQGCRGLVGAQRSHSGPRPPHHERPTIRNATTFALRGRRHASRTRRSATRLDQVYCLADVKGHLVANHLDEIENRHRHGRGVFCLFILVHQLIRTNLTPLRVSISLTISRMTGSSLAIAGMVDSPVRVQLLKAAHTRGFAQFFGESTISKTGWRSAVNSNFRVTSAPPFPGQG